MKIDSLDFSVRLKKRVRIYKTLENLLKQNDDTLCQIKGFGRIESVEIKLIVGKEEYSTSNFYIQEGDYFYNNRNVSLDSVFTTTFYKKKQTQNNRNRSYYGYGYNNTVNKDDLTKVKIDSYKIRARFYIPNYGNNRNFSGEKCEYIEHDFANEEELKKWTFYRNEFFNIDKFIRPRFEDLRIGDYMYLLGTIGGLRKITKIYDYPNKEGKICQIEDADGKNTDILSDDGRLVYPPYKKIESEQSIFNDCLNELSIQPFTEYENGVLSVFWKKIDDAASYTVSIFKIVNNPGYNNVLHIKDYEVDRNDGYFTIRDLFMKNDTTYAVVIKAENRNGDLVAKSRGMEINGRPRYWEKMLSV